MIDDESISLASIFGGIPDLNRNEWTSFVERNDFPDPQDIASPPAYAEAYAAFKMQIAYLRIILESPQADNNYQVGYNIYKCETARLALAKIAAEPEIAKAILNFRGKEEEELRSYETPLPAFGENGHKLG